MIEFLQVTKIYGAGKSEQVVLNNLSFKVERGEMVALRGVSGVGKSTLLALVSGLMRPTSGTVRVLGENLNEMSEDELAYFRNTKLAILLQEPFLFPRMTVAENVALPMTLRNVPSEIKQDKVEKVLQEVGLSELSGKLAATLSGGQAQRVSLARALANGAEVLLADEPTSNLDQETSLKIIELLQKIQREKGLTALIATHDDFLLKRIPKVFSLVNGVLN